MNKVVKRSSPHGSNLKRPLSLMDANLVFFTHTYTRTRSEFLQATLLLPLLFRSTIKTVASLLLDYSDFGNKSLRTTKVSSVPLFYDIGGRTVRHEQSCLRLNAKE
jgi:hypothetical protein